MACGWWGFVKDRSSGGIVNLELATWRHYGRRRVALRFLIARRPGLVRALVKMVSNRHRPSNNRWRAILLDITLRRWPIAIVALVSPTLSFVVNYFIEDVSGESLTSEGNILGNCWACVTNNVCCGITSEQRQRILGWISERKQFLRRIATG